MTSSSSSTPISFQASEPIAINPCRDGNEGRHRSSPQSFSSSSEDEEGRCGASALSAALRDSDSVSELRVGSLPMHLRRAGRGGARHRQGTLSGSERFTGPQSLPPPRAPFLSSKEGPEDALSSMPDMALPESVSSTRPDISTVPYGSLRESRFARPQYGNTHHGGLTKNVRFAGAPENTHTTMNALNEFSLENSFQPHSLPAYSGSGGIGGFISQQYSVASGTSTGSGIGGILQEADGGAPDAASSVEVMTSACSGLTLGESADSPDLIASSHNASKYDNGNVQIDSYGEEANSEPAPLSSSLTAYEYLTLSRGTTVVDYGGTTTDHMSKESDFSNGSAHDANHQYFDPSSTQYANNISTNYELNSDEQNANPDTFEAFDLELDE